MSNTQKYAAAFQDTFQIEADQLDSLTYRAIPAWDSVGHMQLIVALEDAFEIMIDTDDVIDLSSFEKGKEILKKYDVEFD